MIEAAVQGVELVEGVAVEDLAADRIRRDGLLWNFAVLGEAAAQLSAELKQEFADVPWRQPARLRNRIVHGYWSIDLDVVHATAQEQLPGFTADLRRVLAASADQDEEASADRLRPGQGKTEHLRAALDRLDVLARDPVLRRFDSQTVRGEIGGSAVRPRPWPPPWSQVICP